MNGFLLSAVVPSGEVILVSPNDPTAVGKLTARIPGQDCVIYFGMRGGGPVSSKNRDAVGKAAEKLADSYCRAFVNPDNLTTLPYVHPTAIFF